MQQSAATGSFFGGVELEAAIVKKGLCQDLFSPEERQITAFLEGRFLSRSRLPLLRCQIGVYAGACFDGLRFAHARRWWI